MACVIIAAWWLGWSVPIWKSYSQKYYLSQGAHPVKECFTNLGTMIAAIVTIATGNQHIAVAALSVMFPIGLVLFLISAKISKRAAHMPELTPEEDGKTADEDSPAE